MSSLNPAWLIAEAVKTELDAAFADPTAILAGADFGTFSPQSIAVIAPGAEDNRPGIGGRSWVNIYVPEDTAMTWETGNSYLAKPNIRVSVFVEETKRIRGSLHETCLSLSHFITVCLTRSTLNDVARRAPKQTGANTYRQKGETQTWVGEVKLEYEYQGRGAPVDWSKTAPSVAGLTEAAASAAITAAGLTPDSDGAFSNTVAKGVVISQSPAAGTAAYAGDIVTITVSFGVEYKVVPVTKDLLPAAAEAALVAAGLVLGTSTSSMTDDTAVGLVSTSSPAAGTGVAAGTAVDLTVSLGDRRTEIPVYMTPGVLSTLYVTPITAFDWIHPNGTVQNGLTCTYLRPRGSANTPVYIRCKTGKTIADLTSMQNGTNLTTFVMTDDCAYLKPSSGFLSLSCIRGDVAKLAYLAENTTGGINLSDSAYILYGTLNSWGPTNFSYAVFFYCAKVTGSLQFKAGATTADVWFYGYGYTGSSDTEMAQTIINFDAENAGAFTRTFRCLDIKRSAIEAALPGAAAAIVSLIAKGCTFTFKAE